MEERVEEEQRVSGDDDSGTKSIRSFPGSCEYVEVESLSRLVLLEDQEFLLRVSPAEVRFEKWSQNSKVVSVRVELISFCSDPRAKPSSSASPCRSRECLLPVIITPPFTKRFRCVAGRSFARNPFMIALVPNDPVALEYQVEFMRPQASDSDSLWDNFQDQLVFQTRLEKFSLMLKASKHGAVRDHQDSSFYPSLLCEVKAPALKLFDLIEKQARDDTVATSSASSRGTTPTGHGRREILQPLVGKTVANSMTSLDAERKKTPMQLDPLIPKCPKETKPEDFQMNSSEAQAVVLRMRARFKSTQNNKSPVKEPTPESKSEENCAELDEFNQLVAHAKQQVAQQVSDAHNELAYYRALSQPRQQDAESPTDLSPRTNNQAELTESVSKPPSSTPAVRLSRQSLRGQEGSSSKGSLAPIPAKPMSGKDEDPAIPCRPPPRIRASSSKSKRISLASKRQQLAQQKADGSSSEEEIENDAPPVYDEICGGMNELEDCEEEDFAVNVVDGWQK